MIDKPPEYIYNCVNAMTEKSSCNKIHQRESAFGESCMNLCGEDGFQSSAGEYLAGNGCGNVIFQTESHYYIICGLGKR